MTGIALTISELWRGVRAAAVLSLAAACLLAAPPARASSPDDIRQMITEEARETMVPASLAIAVAQVESGLRPDHQGADGARGVFQLLPETAEGLGLDPRQLWQPRTNIRAGLQVLNRLLERTDGRWDDALQAFASRRDGAAAGSAKRYVTDVLGWERRYAERLAAQDAVDGRRREVLKGHDDWGAQAREQDALAAVGRDALPPAVMEELEQYETPGLPNDPALAELQPYLQEGPIDPMLDDDTDVDTTVKIYRGGRGSDVEITIYEEEYEVSPPPPPSAWRPAPRRHAAPPPRRHARPFGWRQTRHARQFRGPRWSPRKAQRMKRAARRMARSHGR